MQKGSSATAMPAGITGSHRFRFVRDTLQHIVKLFTEQDGSQVVIAG